MNEAERIVATAKPQVIGLRRWVVASVVGALGICGAGLIWLLVTTRHALAESSPPPTVAHAAAEGDFYDPAHSVALPTSPPRARATPRNDTNAEKTQTRTQAQQGQGATSDVVTTSESVAAVPVEPPTPSPQQRAAEEHAITLAAARRSSLDLALDTGSSGAPSSSTLDMQTTSDVHPPRGQYVVPRGNIIPASLYTPIDSTIGGPLIAIVRQDVYDATHRFLVIPQGSRLIGAYGSGTELGQARLYLGFTAVELPNRKTIEFDPMPAVDGSGVTGAGGKVDTHKSRFWGSLALLTVLQTIGNLATTGMSGSTNVIINAGNNAAANVVGAGEQLTNQYANQRPTIHVPEGYTLNVMVQRDLVLEPYAQ